MKRVVVRRLEKEKRPRRVVRDVDQCGMREFMSTVDVFLKQRARTLTSFAVIFQVEDCAHWKECRLLKENGLRMPYNAFFQSLLELLENDEGLQLCLEFGFRQSIRYNYDDPWSESVFWNEIVDRCPMTNDSELDDEHWRGSEDIIQLICEIMTKIKANARGDKLIVKCCGMWLTQKCVQFLRFWLPVEDIASRWDRIEFVLR